MAKIDELIQGAQKKVDESSDEDKPRNEAYLKALQDAKLENVTLSQDEVNSIVKREKDSATQEFTDVLGMGLSEAKEVFESMDDETLAALSDAYDEGESDDDEEENPRLQKLVGAVTKLQNERDQGREYSQNLAKDLYSERVENRLKSALGSLALDDGTKVSLKDGRFDRVRSLLGEQDFVEKLMKGESVEADAFTGAAKSLYDDMPEIFTAGNEEPGGDGTRKVAGVTVREEGVRPHIPATPNGRETADITEEDRAARAASAY